MSPVTATVLWAVALLIAWLWRPRQAATLSAWILLGAFGALGAWALWFGLYDHPGEPAGFAFLKPTVLYWTLAAIMIVVPWFGGGYAAKIILGAYFALSNRQWRWINRGLASVCIIFGGVNLWVAHQSSLKDWEGFKYSLMIFLLVIVLFRLNFVWLPILADVSIYLYRRAAAVHRYLSGLF
jgi:intracellular septation protein A